MPVLWGVAARATLLTRLSQATGVPAVSLPNGCRSLPVEVLPMLERFSRVVLWTDNDVAGQQGAERFAQKLGYGRCLVVKPSAAAGGTHGTAPPPALPKDANEALQRGMDLRAMLDAAQPLGHKQIVTFAVRARHCRRRRPPPRSPPTRARAPAPGRVCATKCSARLRARRSCAASPAAPCPR